MEWKLSPVEVRVLGCLVEKEITTPEYYPLSLNALVNACNQKSNRNPVTAYTEADVEQTLASLQKQGFIMALHEAGSRVMKYRHVFGEKVDVGPEGVAILCELMLRGPQTVGELRNRAERMRHFESLESVDAVLQELAGSGFVVRLPREPGRKESRYAHLLSGPVEAGSPGEPQAPDVNPVLELQSAVDALRSDLDALRAEFAEFKKQLGA